MVGAYARLGKTWIDTLPERRDHIIILLKKRVIKQAVGGAKQKSEILEISNRYKDTLNDLVDNSDLELPETLRLNGQRQGNLTPNFEDKPVDIETDLEEFPNIS